MKLKKSYSLSMPIKTMDCVDIYSEQIGLTKSAIISLAVNEYLLKQDNFRKNKKARKIMKEEIEFYEKNN